MLRVISGNSTRYLWLNNGKHGSYQTAREMAQLVRRAAVADIGLERFAVQILASAGLDSHSPPDEIIDALFRYVQSIRYIADTTGTGSFDAIQSARDTIQKGYGDCDDLSVLLATLLAQVGMRPAFVLAKMHESSDGFDHIYVEVPGKDNERTALDPTTRRFGMGWETPKAIERARFPIFTTSGAGSMLGNAKPGAGPTPRFVGKAFDQADKDLAAYFASLSARATLTPEEYQAAQGALEDFIAATRRAIQIDTSGYTERQLQAETPRYNSWLQGLAAKVVTTSPSASGEAPPGVGQTGSATPVLALIIGGVLLYAFLNRG